MGRIYRTPKLDSLSLYPSPSGSPALAQTEVLACVSQCYKNAKTCGYVIWVVPEDRASRGILGGASHLTDESVLHKPQESSAGPILNSKEMLRLGPE
jgi:hypothetical protein